MLDFKELAENILSDLMNNCSMSDVLLKTKIFASKKDDKKLVEWVKRELEGYENKPPQYRIISSALMVNVFVPYRGINRVEFPVEMIQDEDVRNRLSNMPFHNPIAEIENLIKNDKGDGTVKMNVPIFINNFIQEFIHGDIQESYQYVTMAAVTQIIVSVKSVLIDYLLKISNEEDIDFNTFIKNNPSMKPIININAGIVNTGSGDVNAQGATTVVGNNNTINIEKKNELLRIITEIDKIAASHPNPDFDEISMDIKNELQKADPSNNYLKRCFQAIPGFLANVGASIVANKLPELISEAVSLL